MIASFFFVAVGAGLVYIGVKMTSAVSRFQDAAMEDARASGDMDAIMNAWIGIEESEGLGLPLFILLLGLGLIVYGLGGFLQLTHPLQLLISALNDPGY